MSISLQINNFFIKNKTNAETNVYFTSFDEKNVYVRPVWAVEVEESLQPCRLRTLDVFSKLNASWAVFANWSMDNL